MARLLRTPPNWRFLLGAIPLLLLLSGCQPGPESLVIKLAHGLDRADPVHQSMAYMAKLVAERTDGGIRIDIYPNGQLGSERECLELVQLGSLGMTKTSTSVMEGFVPAYRLLSLPYLFRDEDHMFAVLEGDVGEYLLESSVPVRMQGLTFYDAGSRSFYTKSKPIHTPDDLVGMKIRTQESATSMRMVQIMGGSPTPISWGELYTALQQGVVDGAENNPPSFEIGGHFEVCKYYSLDEHTAVPDLLLISTELWERLSPEQQAILQEAAAESAEYQKKIWREATAKSLEFLVEKGVTIIRPDKAPFREKVAPIYAEYEQDPLLKELIAEVRATP